MASGETTLCFQKIEGKCKVTLVANNVASNHAGLQRYSSTHIPDLSTV